MSDEKHTPASAPSRWWREAATLLTVIGLFVTLLFNTLAVRDGAKHAEEARDSERIGLLTGLNSEVTDTEREINQIGLAGDQCEGDKEGTLTGTDEEAELLAALDDFEYVAWLFNEDRLTVLDSRLFFGSRLTDGWRLAKRYLGTDELTHKFPELTEFFRETPRKDLKADECRPRG